MRPPALHEPLPARDPTIATADWGLIAYEDAQRRQMELWRAIVSGRTADTLVSCQHPPTITLGRHAPISDLLLSPTELERRGIAVARSDRGGRTTVHAPGQAVIYPVVAIARRGLGAQRWVALLEDAVMDVLAEFDIRAQRRAGRPGLWTDRGKIAFVGLRISRGVSYHGLAVNVDLDVSLFDCIVPCGAAGDRVTSMAAIVGSGAPSPERVAERVRAAISARIGNLKLT